jgi:prepilin-type N-terminal cleavage/methylation domain-containing protein
MKTRTRAAFTLVELLVVIAIIGIFMAMTIPAVQATREAARRVSCQSHLSHIGEGLSGYEAAYGTLPTGTTEPKGPIHSAPRGCHISWLVRLLPYLGEGVTLKHVDLAAGAYDKKNAPVRGVRISLLVCPSDLGSTPEGVGISNYAGCHHDVEAPIDENNHGVLFLNSHISARDVTDGPANTIYVGEKRCRPDDLGWMSGTRATLRNTGTPMEIGVPRLPKPSGREPSELAVGGFGSAHPDGANFLLGDGAVRFLGRQIDMEVFQQLGHRADGKLLLGGPTREQ